MNEQAKKILEKYSTADLCDLFAKTETRPYNKALATVRGWIMDEIEKRNPQGFEKWLEEYAPDNKLKNYVL